VIPANTPNGRTPELDRAQRIVAGTEPAGGEPSPLERKRVARLWREVGGLLRAPLEARTVSWSECVARLAHASGAAPATVAQRLRWAGCSPAAGGDLCR